MMLEFHSVGKTTLSTYLITKCTHAEEEACYYEDNAKLTRLRSTRMAAPVEPAPVEDAHVTAPQSLMLSKSEDGSFALVAKPRKFLAKLECKPDTVAGAESESEDIDSFAYAAIAAMDKREDKKKQEAKDKKAAAKLAQADDTPAPTGAPSKGSSIMCTKKGKKKAKESDTCEPGKRAGRAALKVKSESKCPPGRLAVHAALKRPASAM